MVRKAYNKKMDTYIAVMNPNGMMAIIQTKHAHSMFIHSLLKAFLYHFGNRVLSIAYIFQK